jgi:phosphorylcholine metabolism protein LicD
MIPVAQERIAGIDKQDCVKLKSCDTAKKTITRVKKQPTEWHKNLCQLFIQQGLISRIYKELIYIYIYIYVYIYTKKTQSINRQMSSTDTFQMKYKWPRNTWKNIQHFSYKDMQIKTALRFHLTSVRMAVIKETTKQQQILARIYGTLGRGGQNHSTLW